VLLAKLLAKVGRNDDAVREARAAIELNPTSSTARYILFRIFRDTGDLKAAQTELEAFQNLKALYGPE
jgi:protein involved in temperature-dependent protein secretion